MIRDDVKLILEGLLKVDKTRVLHITTNQFRFYNGIIIDLKDKSFLNFNDEKLGHILIPYKFINNIEPRVERGDK